jgi:hypothetical protein
MSTIKSSADHLTINADGASKDIKFQANGVQKASISSAGAFTSTTIDATALTGNLPAISGAALTGISGGISEADTWRVNTSFTGYNNPIASNWERDDTYGNGLLGTGMSQSSGIFTFPSTGFWLVTFHLQGYSGSVQNDIYASINVTTDNATYNEAARAINGLNPSGTTSSSVSVEKIVDVTDSSNVKVRLSGGSSTGGWNHNAQSTVNETFVTFIKLGDT